MVLWTSSVAAGPGPARQIGRAAANEVARAHEVSILTAAGIAVGLCRVGSPAVNTSMMRMAEPQHWHGLGMWAARQRCPRARAAAGRCRAACGRARGCRPSRRSPATVVADTVEAAGQHVDQEPADELVRVERHRLIAAGSVDPIVLDLERHRLGIGRDQTPVRDRHAMRVAR